jgi:hypothetical protein
VRRIISLLVAVAALGACGHPPEEECVEFCDTGRIQGVFHLGEETISDFRWIEMVELTGPPGQRCGPGACGMAYAALSAGMNWSPGKWRVIPPHVRGWDSPDPIVVVIGKDRLTTFEANYRPA